MSNEIKMPTIDKTEVAELCETLTPREREQVAEAWVNAHSALIEFQSKTAECFFPFNHQPPTIRLAQQTALAVKLFEQLQVWMTNTGVEIGIFEESERRAEGEDEQGSGGSPAIL